MHRGFTGVAASILLSLALAGCQPTAQEPPASAASALPVLEGLNRPVSFDADVKPVFDNRCVVCHACYDAPCQLVLSSHEGAMRGATQKPVYDSSRLVAMQPTRLFVDEPDTAGWRKRDFFSVLEPDPLLLRMLALGKGHPFAPGKRLPDSVGLDIDRALTCAEGDQFADYAQKHPLGGMPYGTAPLTNDELGVLAAWVAQGAPVPAAVPSSPAVDAQVAIWETFLNGESLKQQLVGRYLYEHWFVADVYFDNLPDSPFLRVVRSRTPPGQPIDEIATVRPYDDPGAKFWYRLRPLHASVVHKTHIVYALGPKRLARLTELFVTPKWQATALPSYAPDVASNPFIAFAEIPARSRYQYMLDDAQYFVMTFIRGPVCRGQVAVDVIQDQFFVSFLDPDHDLSVTDPRFLAQTKALLSLPAENGGTLLPGDLYLDFARKQHKYLAAREAFYAAADPKHLGPTLAAIWDGDGHNTNAQLTVFRNSDNATVVRGFLGALPKTAWVMDYPIFERIYYDLVAGFDIYGNVVHQVSTRLYMD
ncbi:MAG: fatty acid cis/trans isomerase, partial [bacterium]